jgi:hypothetical protein
MAAPPGSFPFGHGNTSTADFGAFLLPEKIRTWPGKAHSNGVAKLGLGWLQRRSLSPSAFQGLQRCQRALGAPARCASSDPSQQRRISPSSSERAVPRVLSVNPTGRICRNELDGSGACLDGAFVPEDVCVVTTGIDKPLSLCVHLGLAVRSVSFVVRHRSHRDDDQAMARVRVPADASFWRPDVALHV